MSTTVRNILVVDDNPSIHEDFRKIFHDVASNNSTLDAAAAELFGAEEKRHKVCYQLDFASQGQEGLEKVRDALDNHRPYSMAFLDVQMPPGWDGIETMARIWEIAPDLQIVICTAYSTYNLRDIIAKVGRSDQFVVLKKPFDSIEVMQLANTFSEKWQLLKEVGERKQGEEQSRTREEQFRTLADNVPDAVARLDRDLRFAYGNKALSVELNLDSRVFLGKTGDELNLPNQDLWKQEVEMVFETGLAHSFEFNWPGPDGICYREARLVPEHSANGEVEFVLTITRDVTRRKRAEVERKLMDLQLRQAQKMEAVGQLAAGIAHEINTPTQYVGDNTRFLKEAFESITTALHGYIELIAAAKKNAITPELIARADKIIAASELDYHFQQIPAAITETLEGVERVSKIVKAMKEFSHPGSREKIAADLNKAVESTVTVARNEWKYVAELELNLDPNLPLVPCFISEFNQAILNLVINASHAISDVIRTKTGSKGKITISTRTDGDHVEVRVADTGTGIPEEHRQKIFEPFFTTKDVGKGTGQGLTAVYSNIVKKHGGTVTFETETGKGTTFILRLPLVAKSGVSSREERADVAAQKGAAAV
ncbi:MAG TPA: ATP-binding protein [Candidatus Polarisedimenticolia bacterium]|nr:ATP-binding protein [Candidatus Polarisedimenticolia bacterium]